MSKVEIATNGVVDQHWSTNAKTRFKTFVRNTYPYYCNQLTKQVLHTKNPERIQYAYKPENSVSRAYIMKIISETRSEHQSRCTGVMVIVEGELFSSCFQLITKNERWNMCNCRLYLFLTVNLACSIKKPASIAIILNWFVHVELWCASLNLLQKMLHWIVTPR